ncbi:PhzF family phenazine biosynthesis protein [bacterium]|nr:PhzF family phenazine biosynthesis protein [bacterium]MBU1883253.1 PhzF family phenazine biosynthesis protein [bacterium]
MKKLKYKKIDAFASSNSSGNPAGVVYLKSFNDINADEMQQIAREQKGFVSEVGFIWEESEGSFGLRYYSSEREVEFCGHATIAIMYDLIKNRADLLAKKQLIIKTKNDILHVENHIPGNDSVFITAPNPKYRTLDVKKEEIASALHADARIIDERFDISVVNVGLETLIVSIKNLEDILHVAPELEILNAFCKNLHVDIVILFTQECFNATNSYRTRVFAATFGYLEDPATGSGNSAFGHYLLKRNMWNGEPMNIEQNGLKENFNTVKLIAKEGKVLFGGGANVKIDGEYFLT